MIKLILEPGSNGELECFGLFIALFLLWQDGWHWKKFGFEKKINLRTILNGLLLAIAMYFVIGICIQPFLEIYFGEVDLSSVDDIRGNFVSFFILFLIRTLKVF